jgi:cytochrome c oxidase subunit 3
MSASVAERPPRVSKPISNESFGMLLLIIAEVMFFAALASVYTVLRFGATRWRPEGLPDLATALTLSNTFVLILSAVNVFLAVRAVRREDPVGLKLHLGITLLLGLTFLAIQFHESNRLLGAVPMAGNVFGSVFFGYILLHGVHVAAGIVILGRVFWRALKGKYHRYRATGVVLASWYWYFVVIVWVFIFLALYVY